MSPRTYASEIKDLRGLEMAAALQIISASGGFMEKLVYEFRPYLFLAAGLIAIVAHVDHLMLLSGFLLVAMSAIIIQNRRKHRAWLAS